MAALGPEQRGDPAVRPRAPHVGGGRRQGQVAGVPRGHARARRRPAPGWRSRRRRPAGCAGTKTDQNWAPTPPARSRGRSVWVGAAGAGDVEPVPVVADPLAQPPRAGRCARRPRGARPAGRGCGPRCPRACAGPYSGALGRPAAQLEWRHGLPLEPRHRRAGHPRVHPQRGRLRGARGPAVRAGLDPRRRRGRGRRRARQHLRVRRAGQEGLHRHAARGGRPQGDRAHQGRRRGGLPGRALRPDPGRRAARRRRGAGLRLLPRHVEPPERHPRREPAGLARALRPAPAAAAVAGRPLGRRPLAWRCPGTATASSSCARGSTPGPGRR